MSKHRKIETPGSVGPFPFDCWRVILGHLTKQIRAHNLKAASGLLLTCKSLRELVTIFASKIIKMGKCERCKCYCEGEFATLTTYNDMYMVCLLPELKDPSIDYNEETSSMYEEHGRIIFYSQLCYTCGHRTIKTLNL